MAQILDGKKVAAAILNKIKTEVLSRYNQGIRAPGLAVIIVGNDPASKIYIEKKRETCKAIGFVSRDFNLAENTSELDLINLIDQLNDDVSIDGILIQLPLPHHLNTNKIIECIHYDKDVDGFHPYNVGLLATGRPCLRSCTPKGIITLLKSIDAHLVGTEVVIVGASNIVGRPMALEFLLAKSTVTICHAATKNLKNHIKNAEVLVAAAGVPSLIKGEWIKEGAIVIDVGFTRLANGKIAGDVEFFEAQKRASWITPVPGGVGPMTVASLMENTFYAQKKLHQQFIVS